MLFRDFLNALFGIILHSLRKRPVTTIAILALFLVIGIWAAIFGQKLTELLLCRETRELLR